jgi:DNA topoisomerase-1
MKATKWWEQPELPAGLQWNTLEHNGVFFPPPYVAHNVKLLYDGEPVDLNDDQEELASFYAGMPVDGPQLGDAKTAKVFNANFFKDFKAELGPKHTIQKFEKCDFSKIRAHLDKEKVIKKAATDEEKEDKKATEQQLVLQYGYALVDGNLQKLGNFRMEPPGLFRGRGAHPLTGRYKRRVSPEDVIINIGENAAVPPCPIPGHTWKEVVHKPEVTWLAQWQENVLQQHKYVMLAASSSFKGKSDVAKYNKAIRLKHKIGDIRKDYKKKLKSKVVLERQTACAMWLIDILALRVGGEKGDDEADTVGCCSLRVEHMTFNPDPEKFEMELEFLGKDSMLFKQNVDFGQYEEVGKEVLKCLKKFCEKRKPADQVFDQLAPSSLNQHLSSLMPGLSAKVFRTYNASITLEQQLPEADKLDRMSVADKVVEYNGANRTVAILCNHQKTVPKTMEQGLSDMEDKLKLMQDQRDELIEMKKLLAKGKTIKNLLSDDDSSAKATAAVAKAKDMTAKAKTEEQKLAATAQKEKSAIMRREAVAKKFKTAHLYAKQPSADQVNTRIKAWDSKIKTFELNFRNKVSPACCSCP